MRQTSIPKAVVDALNELFDKNPKAVSQLACVGFRTDASAAALEAARVADAVADRISREQAYIDDVAEAGDTVGEVRAIPRGVAYRELGIPDGERVSVLDVINTILEAVAPGKRVVTIHGPDGMDGFTLARERRIAPQNETSACS